MEGNPTLNSAVSDLTIEDVHQRSPTSQSTYGQVKREDEDASAVDEFPYIPLHDLVRFADDAAFETLAQVVELYPDIDCLDEDGLTPLHVAALNGLFQKVSILINTCSADVNRQTENAARRTPLVLATMAGQIDVVEELLSCPEIDIDLPDASGTAAIHHSMDPKLAYVAILLVASGAKLNVQTKRGDVPLCLAIYHKMHEIVDLMIASDVDVNLCSADGRFPINMAIQFNDEKSFNTLVSAGARIDAENVWPSLMHEAAAYGSNSIVPCLLEYGFAIDQRSRDGQTPLMQACTSGQTEMVQCLLADGASLRATDNNGATAFFFAAFEGREKVLEILFQESGANILVNSPNSDKVTPLLAAIVQGHDRVVDILLRNNADPLQEGPGGVTPIAWATADGRTELVVKLKEWSVFQQIEDSKDTIMFREFLPPSDSAVESGLLAVPYLCGEWLEQDLCKLDFTTHPERKNWLFEDKIGFLRLDNSEVREGELSTFLQAWLFFGSLHWVLSRAGIRLNLTSLVRRDQSGKLIVVTKMLPEYLSEFLLAGHSLDPIALQEIDLCLNTGNWIADNLFSWKRAQDELNGTYKSTRSNEVKAGVAQSISMLGELLCIVRGKLPDAKQKHLKAKIEKELAHHNIASHGEYQAFKSGYDPSRTIQQGELSKSFSKSTFYTFKEMLRRGRCRSEASILHSSTLGPRALYWMSMMPYQGPRLDHQNCNDHECKAQNIDESRYEINHAKEGCVCDLVPADSAETAAIWERGRIPVAQVTKTLDENGQTIPTLQVLEKDVKKLGDSYLTVSHVWAQGLGNPVNNALPQCQIFRLKSLFERLTSVMNNVRETETSDLADASRISVPFWIDTICIPLDRLARAAALRMLDTTYRESKATLVLDSTLFEIKTSTSPAEILAHIIMSPWMRRLWTLQEGLLCSDRLYFQLEDGVVKLTDLYDAGPTLSSRWTDDQIQRCFPELHDGLSNNLNALIPGAWQLFRQHDIHALNTIANCVSSRTSTRKSDEFKCFASLLRLDPSKIHLTEESRRPYEFYRQLASRESSIGLSPTILLASGPRLSERGFKWAPASFLARSPSTTFDLHFGKVRNTHWSNDYAAEMASGLGIPLVESSSSEGLKPCYCDDQGLHVNMSGWIITLPGKEPLKRTLEFEDSANNFHYVIDSGADLKLFENLAASLKSSTLGLLFHPSFGHDAVILEVTETALSETEIQSRYLWRVRFTQTELNFHNAMRDFAKGAEGMIRTLPLISRAAVANVIAEKTKCSAKFVENGRWCDD